MSVLDGIEALDWGAYSHFRFQADLIPEFMPLMRFAYYFSDDVCIGVLFSIAALLFFLQGRYRSANVVAITFAVAVSLLITVQYWFPRQRPTDGRIWLGGIDWRDSYPSKAVMLFMLAMIFIGFALGRVVSRRQLVGFIAIAFTSTVWVCFSQFLLGLHFITDVLGAIAGATLLGCWAHLLLCDDQTCYEKTDG